MAAEEGGEGGERSSSPVTYTYRALRAVFTAGLKGFYNTVEVSTRCDSRNYFPIHVQYGLYYILTLYPLRYSVCC